MAEAEGAVRNEFGVSALSFLHQVLEHLHYIQEMPCVWVNKTYLCPKKHTWVWR